MRGKICYTQELSRIMQISRYCFFTPRFEQKKDHKKESGSIINEKKKTYS